MRAWCSQRHPPAGSSDARCVKCGGQILPDLYGDDGKRDFSPIGSSRIRFLPLRLNVAALGRPGVSLCRHCATSLAIRQYVSLNPRQRGSTAISEPHFIVFIGISTTIGNCTDGLVEPTGRGWTLPYGGQWNRDATGMIFFSDRVLPLSFPTR